MLRRYAVVLICKGEEVMHDCYLFSANRLNSFLQEMRDLGYGVEVEVLDEVESLQLD